LKLKHPVSIAELIEIETSSFNLWNWLKLKHPVSICRIDWNWNLPFWFSISDAIVNRFLLTPEPKGCRIYMIGRLSVCAVIERNHLTVVCLWNVSRTVSNWLTIPLTGGRMCESIYYLQSWLKLKCQVSISTNSENWNWMFQFQSILQIETGCSINCRNIVSKVKLKHPVFCLF